MKKELKDYLHFYPACNVMFGDIKYKIWYIKGNQVYLERISEAGFQRWGQCDIAMKALKPILRPLSDMTEDECNEYNRLCDMMYSLNRVQDQIKASAAATNYLRKHKFDVDDLIETGLAIDATTLKTQS